MRRLRWWSMFLLSAGVGHLLGVLLIIGGERFSRPISQLVLGQARKHADEAAEKRGPYLAPVTAVVILALIGLTVWVVVR